MSAGKSEIRCVILVTKNHTFFRQPFWQPSAKRSEIFKWSVFPFLRCLCYFVYQILSRLFQVCWSYSRKTKSDNLKCCMLQHNKASNTKTSRPAIAGNPHCKNITAKSLHLTSLYPTALTSTNDHLSVLCHYVCT